MMTIEKKTIRSDIPGHQTYHVSTTSDDMRRLVVGREIALNGTIAACDHLVIEGLVEAASFGARRMDISETGVFAGAAEVTDAVIAGRFEGRLTVTGRLLVKSTGRIYGEISYGALEVEAGAAIEGHMAMMAPPQVEAKPEPEIPVQLQAPYIGNNVEKLFDDEGDADEGKQESPRVFRRAVGF